jgi:hypothetical protein
MKWVGYRKIQGGQCDAQRANRFRIRVGDLLSRKHEFFDVPRALLVESLSDRGQHQLSGGSKNQLAVLLVFKLLNASADRVRRHPDTACRFGETPGSDHLDE